jgi:aspartyl-tRNA(Asn)/glutamyl-tRNA(Gln) amidotransferase subunit A
VPSPNASSRAAGSPTGSSLHAALEQIDSYPVERNWRPAFLAPLSTLPRSRRAYLADLPGKRPLVPPFAGQPLTIAAAIHALRTGSLTVAGLVEQMFAAIGHREPTLAALAYITPAAELYGLARQLDAELRAGVCRGTLHGIPLAVQELIDVAGLPGTSSPLPDGNLSPFDAGSVRLLKAAGAVVMGKSSGSATAVAVGMSLGAVATDMHISLCVAAASCGVVGYKPTFGLVPGDGLRMLAWSLEHVGHMTPTVEDAALMLDVLDPAPHVQYSQGLHKNLHNVRVGVPAAALEGAEPGVKAAFGRAVAAMRQTGAEITEIGMPAAGDFDLAVSVGLVVSHAEAAAYHAVNSDHSRRSAVSATQQVDEAARVSAIHYLQAQRAREDLRWRMLRSFDQFDVLLMPAARAVPKSGGPEHDFPFLAQNSILWSVLGFPAITLPCGRTPLNFPIGAQLVAAPYEDARLLSIAAALELELSHEQPSPSGAGLPLRPAQPTRPPA